MEMAFCLPLCLIAPTSFHPGTLVTRYGYNCSDYEAQMRLNEYDVIDELRLWYAICKRSIQFRLAL